MKKFLTILIGTIAGDLVYEYVIKPKINEKKDEKK